MKYDTATQEIQFQIVEEFPRTFEDCSPELKSKIRAQRALFADPVELAKINTDRIASGRKPVVLPEGWTL